MDIKANTALVIRKGDLYVQTESAVIGGTIWSPHAYDAMRTRNVHKAIETANAVGGEIWLFNPIACQLRKADMNKILKRMEETNHD